ncbi:MAG: DNA topoisomerase IV subunit A [Azospirillaceae bacterium]
MSDTANVISVPLTRALSERYLSYALSTIVSRSLPDVRDGLKPVHRRVLYAMRQLKLSPNQAPKKSARVIGDVIGQYHPHGEQSVYDALVRLAQDFAQRYPLVDGQGNFGNIDGDSAAAMRYTEARLTAIAELLLEGIDEDSVDFKATYDEEGREPLVLPANFPNLLANGAQGIAVGMATSIPPHNAAELCDALVHLIDRPDADGASLLDFVKGPDFPTGGILVETPQAIAEAYATGRGGFRVRARWAVEKLPQGQYQIVVTEIPYQVPKARLVEKIADLINGRKLPVLEDIRDESAEDVRLVLVPKSRNVDADQLMEHLFRLSDLESRIPLNLNVLDGGQVPKVMSLKQALRAFLDHRHEVLIRRSRFRLARIEQRLEVLEGYLVAYLNLDEVIRIIREEDEPKQVMVDRFGLTDNQVEAVLNMRLRALRKLEEIEIRKEHDGLTAERDDLTDLLGDEDRRWATLKAEVGKTRDLVGPDTSLGRRRTVIGEAASASVVPLESIIEREPVTVYLSQKGWIRAVKGHQDLAQEVRHKEGDSGRYALHAETPDKILVFATNGRLYALLADKLPRGRGFGEPLRMMIDLPNDADVVALRVHKPGGRLLVASDDGRGFIVPEDEVVAQTRAGKQVLNVSGAVEAAVARPVAGDHVAVLGHNRKLLVFPIEELPEMSRGKGVMLQRYRDGGMADVVTFDALAGLAWGRRTFSMADLMAYLGKRAAAGRLVQKGFPRANRIE